MATIATHNGSKVRQAHNRREEKVVSKEPHIDENGVHEEWLDIDEREIYHELFDEAMTDYNAKQKRKDRQIDDYYESVKKDAKKHTSYEMIVGVYDEELSNVDKKAILKRFYNEWEERNPNLKLFGAYYHEDEEGQPHVHLDYIPIAQCTRGMGLQNSLTRALNQQGIEGGKSIHETPQILWEKRENARLEEICNEMGVYVTHEEWTRNHMSVSEYKNFKLSQENQKLKQENGEIKDLSEKAQRYENANAKNYKAALHYKAKSEKLEQENEALKQENEDLKTKNKKLVCDYNEVVDAYNELYDNTINKGGVER